VQLESAVPPLRLSFRREARERAIETAFAITVEQGWEAVRLTDVAVRVGVSRPVLYKEFGSKQGLGEAVWGREVERFLSGLLGALGAVGADVAAGIEAAVDHTLRSADSNPLLHAVLTGDPAGGDTLLPLLTVRSGPMLAACTAALGGWLAARVPAWSGEEIEVAVDSLVRLTVSHLVTPAGPPEVVAPRLAAVALRYLGVPTDGAPVVGGPAS